MSDSDNPLIFQIKPRAFRSVAFAQAGIQHRAHSIIILFVYCSLRMCLRVVENASLSTSGASAGGRMVERKGCMKARSLCLPVVQMCVGRRVEASFSAAAGTAFTLSRGRRSNVITLTMTAAAARDLRETLGAMLCEVIFVGQIVDRRGHGVSFSQSTAGTAGVAVVQGQIASCAVRPMVCRQVNAAEILAALTVNAAESAEVIFDPMSTHLVVVARDPVGNGRVIVVSFRQ